MEKIIYACLILGLVLQRCSTPKEQSPIQNNFEYTNTEALQFTTGQTVYVPIYSDVYHQDESRKFLLTATMTIRNISMHDSLYVTKADYYDSKGSLLRQYTSGNILVRPLETIEFVVEDKEDRGGSGANFIVEWRATKNINIPIIEAVMIGTASTQGISFLTKGEVIDSLSASDPIQ